jgi:uncharacterized protein (DUF302 family)
MTANGLSHRVSNFSPEETATRLVAAVTGHGMIVLSRIDHAAAAAEVGMRLRPTEVLFFGNPKAGTPLMQAHQAIGIDLPHKALVWQDESGKTWLTYNDPAWLATRHGVSPEARPILESMATALTAIAKQATGQTEGELP